jgi:hypothetical protein
MTRGEIHAHLDRMYLIFTWWSPLLRVMRLSWYALLLTWFAAVLGLPSARDAFCTVALMQGLSSAGWLIGKAVIEWEMRRFERRMRGES